MKIKKLLNLLEDLDCNKEINFIKKLIEENETLKSQNTKLNSKIKLIESDSLDLVVNEKETIEKALQTYSKRDAAKVLNLSERTLYRKIIKHNI